ncbi:Squamous cell carcinoma antigen recognized by T-cells 3 [Clydaea vesicula]|uniref:Squamous cell carcinoma antigen recognized by T-cells 3 n=1 Tax=Clydaea vesicula TaxID=447962 RepID=A0AAD5XVS7_9FUNG|nr:Squamous cell carcinoma antigen recognized by T-cells 3 [Clydaea vesicula]
MSSNSSDDELDHEEAGDFDQKIVIEELKLNPENYELHLLLISNLKKSGNLTELRKSREYFLKTYPLSEEIWLDWLKDEKAIAVSTKDKINLLNLYAVATKDYLSIKIWRDYLVFAIKGYFTKDFESEEIMEDDDEDNEDEMDIDEPWLSISAVREICFNAIGKCGYHFEKSHEIWNLWKDFEINVLKNLCEKKEKEEQTLKLRTMFLERLQVPHSKIEKTFESYSSFESNHDNENYLENLKAANVIVTKVRPSCEKKSKFEETLRSTEYELTEFIRYIEYEKHIKSSKVLIKTLYERAVKVHCLNPIIWEHYLNFMICSFKLLFEDMRILLERAVRNCPWSSSIWSHYIRAIDLFGKPNELETENVEELANLLQAHCDHLKHNVTIEKKATKEELESLTSLYVQNIAYMKQQFPTGDPQARLEKSLLEIYIILKDDMKIRELYETILKIDGTNTEIWLDFAKFEKDKENFPKVTNILKRSLLKKLDSPSKIFNFWLAFERMKNEPSKIIDYYEALNKYTVLQFQYGTNLDKDSNKKKLNKKSESDFNTQVVSDKKNENDGIAVVEKSIKRKNTSESTEPNSRKKMKVATPEDDLEAEPIIKKGIDTYIVIDSPSAGNMVHVTNFPPGSDKLYFNEIFKSCGKVVDVVIREIEEKKDEKAALIEFSNVEEVKKAILLNIENIKIERCRPKDKIWEFSNEREPNKVFVSKLWPDIEKSFLAAAQESLALNKKELLPGKTIFVAISNPKEKSKPLHVKKELLISNLPYDIDENVMREMFSKFGTVKDIRLKKKGLYAQKGLSMTGHEVGGRIISVSFPDPNFKKKNAGTKNEFKPRNFDKKVNLASKPSTTFVPPRITQKKKMLVTPKADTKLPQKKVVEGSKPAEGKNQEYFRKIYCKLGLNELATSASDYLISKKYYHAKQKNGITLQTRNNIQSRIQTTILQIHSTINVSNLQSSYKSFFNYIWDLQNENNSASNEEETFFINWTIEHIWKKWESNSTENPTLPQHILDVVGESNELAQLEDLAFVLSSPTVIFLSGSTEELNTSESSDADSGIFLADEQMPDLLTEQSPTDSAKDFDILPAKLLLFLFYSLESLSNQDFSAPLKNKLILDSLLAVEEILNGPRRADHTFVSFIAAWSIKFSDIVKSLCKIAERLPSELARGEAPDSSKTSLSILSNFLSILDEFGLFIPHDNTLNINMTNFLDLIDVEIVKFGKLLENFEQELENILLYFLDIITPLMCIVECQCRLSYRRRGELPHESIIFEFCSKLYETLYKISKGLQVRESKYNENILKTIALRIEKFLSSIKKSIRITIGEQDDQKHYSERLFHIFESFENLLDLIYPKKVALQYLKKSCVCESNEKESTFRHCHNCKTFDNKLILKKKKLIGQRVLNGKKVDLNSMEHFFQFCTAKGLNVPNIPEPTSTKLYEQNEKFQNSQQEFDRLSTTFKERAFEENRKKINKNIVKEENCYFDQNLEILKNETRCLITTFSEKEQFLSGLDDVNLDELFFETASNCMFALSDVKVSFN